MLRVLTFLTLTCLLGPAFADERAQTQQQIEATRKDIAELQNILNHAHPQITLRYIGITDEQIESNLKAFRL